MKIYLNIRYKYLFIKYIDLILPLNICKHLYHAESIYMYLLNVSLS